MLFCSLEAAVAPNPLFSDHCVLQRSGPVPVWGTAEPGESVKVIFRGHSVETTTADDGHWQVGINPGEAGGPFRLEISGRENLVVVNDVFVGEVWLASGQSNMAWTMDSHGGAQPVVNGYAEMAKADHPGIRQFLVERRTAWEPKSEVEGSWVVCTPESVADFSAVAYFFAKELKNTLGVPVGIVHSSWGGTPAQAWTSEEAVSKIPEYAEEIAARKAAGNSPEEILAQFYGKLDQWLLENDPGSESKNSWSQPQKDLSAWSKLEVPQKWDLVGYDAFDGVAWLRTTFDLSSAWSGSDLVLNLGQIDDLDTAWVNGEEVGRSMGWSTIREYPVPAEIVNPGQNEVVIRIVDIRGAGGIWNLNRPPFVAEEGDEDRSRISLAGKWDFRISLELENAPPMPAVPILAPQREASLIYNAMIAPLVPFSFRGVIWYQGEANAIDPLGYRELFPTLIEDWRERWEAPQWPFLFVQIAPFADQPPEIREAQLLTLKRVPETAMVVTLDVGNPHDIHPLNKQPVGERLALAARALAYGEDLVYSGPIFESAEFSEGKATVSFSSVGPGLVAAGGKPLYGFSLAGADGEFHAADALIEGDRVVVSSGEVDTPTAVRYAWENAPEGNLYNRAGLPASPFRSDVE
jgi:sialate O-acetylesterase